MPVRPMSGGIAVNAAYLSDVGRIESGQELSLAARRDRADAGPADNVPNA